MTSATLPLAEIAGNLESAWADIRERHPAVPQAAIVLASGSDPKGGLVWGHYARSRWHIDGSDVAEVLVSGEGLKRGPVDLLVTLLHEATHGVADTRGIKDTSRQGRYHNTRFAGLARGLGLLPRQDARIGWSPCELAPETMTEYRSTLERLRSGIVVYRHAERSIGEAARAEKKRTGEIRARCECGRSIRAARSILVQGGITCECCGGEFEWADDDGIGDGAEVD